MKAVGSRESGWVIIFALTFGHSQCHRSVRFLFLAPEVRDDVLARRRCWNMQAGLDCRNAIDVERHREAHHGARAACQDDRLQNKKRGFRDQK